VINDDERISQAVTFDQEVFTGPAVRQYTNSDMRFTVNSTPSPFTARVEEYWVAADDEAEDAFAYVVSPDRYWRIAGNMPEGASLSGRFTYDGRPGALGELGLWPDAGLGRAGLPRGQPGDTLSYRARLAVGAASRPDAQHAGQRHGQAGPHRHQRPARGRGMPGEETSRPSNSNAPSGALPFQKLARLKPRCQRIPWRGR
jgi:hypothetical protein